MTFQQWLDRLHHELQKRGLPSSYSARLAEELTEHFTDIQMENQSMDAQPSVDESLGSPELVATAAQREFAGRTFAGRYPFLAFILLPIPTAFLFLFGTGMLLWPLFHFVEWSTGCTLTSFRRPPVMPTTFEWSVTYTCLYLLRFLPLLLASWVFWYLGHNSRRPSFGAIACGFVALVGLVYWAEVHQGPGPLVGKILCGFGYLSRLDQWTQALLPLVFGLNVWFRMSARSPSQLNH